MAITPRTPDEIRQNLIAYLVSTGALTSIDQGDVVGTIFGGIAEELSSLENKLLDFVRGHLLDVSGQLLDDRVAQIPNVAPRRANVPAVGTVKLIRSPANTETLTFQPRTLVISNPSYPDIPYVNRDAILMTTDELQDVAFIATVPGARSNAPRATVTNIVTGQGLSGCINTSAFSGGIDRENDTFFRQRAMAMIMSLARSQAAAIEALALNFTDSTGAGILHARAIEYVHRTRGYTELIVSNGEGVPGSIKVAAATQGVVPDLPQGSRYTFWFEAPAASHPVLNVNGASTLLDSQWWLPIEEKGVGWTQGVLPEAVQPGATWRIAGHRVYQGWIKEFQEVVNRTCVAAGTRVRVMPAEPQYVRISANCVVRSGYSFVNVRGALKAMIVEFFNRIPPGAPALIHQLHDWVARVDGLSNIIFYNVQGKPQEDLYPASERKKLTTDLNRITLT